MKILGQEHMQLKKLNLFKKREISLQTLSKLRLKDSAQQHLEQVFLNNLVILIIQDQGHTIKKLNLNKSRTLQTQEEIIMLKNNIKISQLFQNQFQLPFLREKLLLMLIVAQNLIQLDLLCITLTLIHKNLLQGNQTLSQVDPKEYFLNKKIKQKTFYHVKKIQDLESMNQMILKIRKILILLDHHLFLLVEFQIAKMQK